jgi:ferrochelatase
MSDLAQPPYDAVLIVSFGGPERKEDVLPFLENVLRGKPVPRERLLEVAEHYHHFGGKSPLNDQNRSLVAAIEQKLAGEGPRLRVYLGNRNWHPLLSETLAQMADDGVRRALAFFTSAFSSYSGCRQYRENIADAQRIVGARAPGVDKLRGFFNHPEFIAAVSERVREAIARLPRDRQGAARVVYTAHSIPRVMADHCQYEAQLREASRLVSQSLGHNTWNLAYQSRSGSPAQPWLGPDIGDELRRLAAEKVRDVVVVPIGFISDHIEVIYDLDTEAKAVAEGVGIHMVRAATVGTHPRFIAMIHDLIAERLDPALPRVTVGRMPACPDVCPEDCCLARAVNASGSGSVAPK